MKAYKGFNKDMTCRGFKFEEGKTYHEEEAELCQSGFHACEDPLDCLQYYPPATSIYREVELNEVSSQRENDSKVVGKTIKIGAKVDIDGIIKASIEYRKEKSKKATADGRAKKDVTGYSGCSTSGDFGCSTSRGASQSGRNGVSVARGNGCKVQGGLGALLVIAEENDEDYKIKVWKAVVVDGEKIKADVWYKLQDGEFVEVDADE